MPDGVLSVLRRRLRWMRMTNGSKPQHRRGDWIVGERLGSGGNADVFQVQHHESGSVVT
jgi:hypothetical protein